MIERKVSIETYLLKVRETVLYSIYLFSFIFIGLVASGLVGMSVKPKMVPLVVILAIFFFFIFPLVYLSKKPRLFKSKALLKFTPDSLTIEILKDKNQTKVERYYMRFQDVKSFKVSEEEQNHTSSLKLITRDGTKVQFSFFEQQDDDENIIKNVLLYLKSFNAEKAPYERISLLPGFFNTQKGKMIFSLFIGSIIILSFLLIFIRPEVIPLGFIFGIVFYLRVKALQKKDLQIANRFQ